jgi:hypothetical protein
MVTLGVILLVLGLIFGVSVLWVLGAVLVIVGLIANVGYARPRGGRYWY